MMQEQEKRLEQQEELKDFLQQAEQQAQSTAQAETTPANQEEAEEPLPTKPIIAVRLVREEMEAELTLSRSSSNTLHPEFEDIMAALEEKGVRYGINERLIRSICAEPQFNNVDVVARGTPPEAGNDGWVTYRVRTAKEFKPRIREDDSVDFKDIGFIENVQKDQVLCDIHLPEKGPDGMDVTGKVLEGLYGRIARSPQGENTYVTEEGTELRASCYGNVEVKNGTVHVREVVKIEGDVDNSTGNIFFPGDVFVSGDVKAGFHVQAGGSIVVKGNVEAANLEAAVDISIGENVNGGGKGVLAAGGSIKCKYIQSCAVSCLGSLYADALMYCLTQVGGDLELTGKRAAVIGGKTSVAGKLVAKSLGTSTHAYTEINMCATGLEMNQETIDLTANIKMLDGELKKLVQILNRYEEITKEGGKLTEQQLLAIQAVRESYVQYLTQRKKDQLRLEQVQREQLEASRKNSYIECRDRIHTGVKITFGPAVMQVSESFVYSRIHVVKDKILVSPL